MLKIKNPVSWFFVGLLMLGFYQSVRNDGVKSSIRSDGRGYYAYLPALFIYDDPTFKSSMKAELDNSPMISDQLYVYKDENGNFFNKYFPGIAVLQLPFFGLACFFSWVLGFPVDGYNTVFYFFFLLGGIIYGIAGFFLFFKSLKLLFPSEIKRIEWLVPVFYISSALTFYSINTPSFGHLYSFFLFGIFTLLVLRIRGKQSFGKLLLLGVVLGLITLIRPTNILVVLIIPFLLGSLDELKSFLRNLFDKKGVNFCGGLIGFSMILFIQLALWKWQSGEWIKWSYNGEGFNFLHPELWAGFFSFRIGLFLHVPILLFSLLGIVSIFKKKSFKVGVWSCYFLINSWVILSWWCWDYESNFGPRPFTEHLFFLLIPVVYFAVNFPKWLVISGLTIVTLYGGIRYWELQTDFISDQRFTSANYLTSLKFWKKENSGRWNFTRSTVPHGKLKQSELLLHLAQIQEVKATDDFSIGVESALLKPRTNERLYYRVNLDKKQREDRFEGVYLVIDAYTKDQKKRYYKAVDLFNDRLEGRENWAHLQFEGQIYDNFQEYDFVKFYIWNQGKKNFLVKDVQIRLDTYKN